MDLIHSWDSSQEHTSWIIKKGLRTLIKQGDKRVLEYLGYLNPTMIVVGKVKMTPDKFEIGKETLFSFEILNQSSNEVPLLIDYIVHYVKKSGLTSAKVFKLKETKLAVNDRLMISKKLVFKQLSTRIHYPGKHKIEVFVNGEVKAETSFELL
jgi:hypothetical protein